MTTIEEVTGYLSLITVVIVILAILGGLLYIWGYFCLVKFKRLRPKGQDSDIKHHNSGNGDIGPEL
jgi:hypothetical protein